MRRTESNEKYFQALLKLITKEKQSTYQLMEAHLGKSKDTIPHKEWVVLYIKTTRYLQRMVKHGIAKGMKEKTNEGQFRWVWWIK